MTTCARCRIPTAPSELHRLEGLCARCLGDMAACDEFPEFPDLEILEVLGQGGMGVVYRARQTRLGRVVALKVLSPRLPGGSGFVERFTREARVLAGLSHPNIVTIHEFGVHDGAPFLIMELIEGITLRERLIHGKLPAGEAFRLVAQLCDALQYAHARGVVHRDVKPENILIDPEGRVKIADFGLARLASDEVPRLTEPDVAMGTPHYMAPEQLERPGDVDHRADIYSIGVLFYEVLTGELPLGRFDPPSKRAETDPRIDPVVLKALERERDRRYSTASAMGEDVARLGAPPRRRLVGWIVLAALAGAAALLVWRPPSPPSWEECGGSLGSGGLSGTAKDSRFPCVRVDRRGHPIVAWFEEGGVYLRRWDGAAWRELGGSTTGTGLGPADTAPWKHRVSLALDGEGRPAVAWNHQGEIRMKRWTGTAWEDLGNVSESPGESFQAAVEIDASGRPVVAWIELAPGAERVCLKRWNGTAWEGVGNSASDDGVSGAVQTPWLPALTLDRAGRPIVVWNATPGKTPEVYLRRWDGAAWVQLAGSGEGEGLSGGKGRSWWPQVAADAEGRPVVAWHDDVSGNFEAYLRRWDGTAWGEFGGSATAGGVSRTPAPSYRPKPVFDSLGRLVLVWSEEPWPLGQAEARRWDGAGWVNLGRIPSAPRTLLQNVDVALDALDRPVVVWHDKDSGNLEVGLARRSTTAP